MSKRLTAKTLLRIAENIIQPENPFVTGELEIKTSSDKESWTCRKSPFSCNSVPEVISFVKSHCPHAGNTWLISWNTPKSFRIDADIQQVNNKYIYYMLQFEGRRDPFTREEIIAIAKGLGAKLRGV